MEKLFNIVKRGYDQDEVDNYIMTLEALIKSYKDKDDTIKNAIINAQISADNIIKNAEIEAERIKKRAIRLLSEIQTSIEGQKRIAREFQDDYNRLTTKYLQGISNAELEKVLDKITELEQYVSGMQKTHEIGGARPVPGSVGSGLPKMVTGTSSSKHVNTYADFEPNDDELEEDTVALVAELLARDKS